MFLKGTPGDKTHTFGHVNRMCSVPGALQALETQQRAKQSLFLSLQSSGFTVSDPRLMIWYRLKPEQWKRTGSRRGPAGKGRGAA